MSEDSTEPVAEGTEPAAVEGAEPIEPSHEDVASVVEPAPLEPPPDYEKAFHELFEHAEQLQGSVATLTHDREQLQATVSDLESKLTHTEAAITDFGELSSQYKLEIDTLTGQLGTANAELTTLRAAVAEHNRLRTALNLYGGRAAGDRTDRMILAESAADAAKKLAGDPDRLVIVTRELIW